MKRLIYSAFIAFLASTATIGILATLVPEAEKRVADHAGAISLRELARHRTIEDCWMAIEGQVYDLSRYIPMHPTAPEVVTEWCGKEASEAFNTKGYGSPHSPFARAMLGQYLAGKLTQESSRLKTEQ